MADLTPYDTGERLEPRLWIQHTPVVSRRMADNNDAWGRVDFENESSSTVLTIHVERTPEGYAVVIDQHTSDEITVTCR